MKPNLNERAMDEEEIERRREIVDDLNEALTDVALAYGKSPAQVRDIWLSVQPQAALQEALMAVMWEV